MADRLSWSPFRKTCENISRALNGVYFSGIRSNHRSTQGSVKCYLLAKEIRIMTASKLVIDEHKNNVSCFILTSSDTSVLIGFEASQEAMTYASPIQRTQ